MKALVVTLLFLLIACSVAKRYTKCELASILKKNGMERYFGYSLDDCKFTLSFSLPQQDPDFQKGCQMEQIFSRITSTSPF